MPFIHCNFCFYNIFCPTCFRFSFQKLLALFPRCRFIASRLEVSLTDTAFPLMHLSTECVHLYICQSVFNSPCSRKILGRQQSFLKTTHLESGEIYTKEKQLLKSSQGSHYFTWFYFTLSIQLFHPYFLLASRIVGICTLVFCQNVACCIKSLGFQFYFCVINMFA